MKKELLAGDTNAEKGQKLAHQSSSQAKADRTGREWRRNQKKGSSLGEIKEAKKKNAWGR